MIELRMLPGKDGDCLLLSYGEPDAPRRVLIDAGRAATYPLIKPVLDALVPPALDLVVVTHVDQDHVLGVLALLDDPERVAVGEVWFNGFDHLLDNAVETFDARDGELLTTAIGAQRLPWNRAFDGRAIEVDRAQQPRDDGARFDIVAPTRRLLERLEPQWLRECTKHGLIPGVDPLPPVPDGFEHFDVAIDVDALAATPFHADTSRANASSIGFLFEFAGVRILFTGDGDDRCLVESLRRRAEIEGGRVRLDAMKVAHHGSAGNISRELLELVECPRYLFSTNGDRHGHPDPVAVSRILVHGGAEKELLFNYRERAQPWDTPRLRETCGYTVTAPPPEQDGFLTLAL